MRKFALALALTLLPAAAFAQQTPPQPGGRGPGMGRMQQNTIEWLLTQKEQFRPTADQVTQLEALAKALTDSVAPMREQMRKARQDAMEGGGDPAEMREKMRPMMDKLRKQDEEATEAALKVLNDEQRKVVKDLLDQRRKEMEARRGGFR